jgi:UDP-N-acetylmuramoyl-L-alanyl-D-glutamate--2,6-diaminopimelate ligase
MFSLNSSVSLTTLTQLVHMLGNFLPANLHNSNLVIDSRKVNETSVFCAYPGTSLDGRNYIEQAIKQGARYILWENSDDYQFKYDIANCGVKHLINYVGLLAATQFAYPSRKMQAIGVTGTNGKTSITHWLNQAYSHLNKKCAIIGTTGAGVYPKLDDFSKTTPDPITLQELLAKFVAAQVDMLAMEVSSHSLVQGRVNGVEFQGAIFTNLTQDHLDYHHTMEAYYLAKRELFYWQSLRYAVINTDDAYGLRLYPELKVARPELKLITYGFSNADVVAKDVNMTLGGVSFSIEYKQDVVEVQVPVVGRFNVYNLLALVAYLLIDGYKLEIIGQILPQLVPVRGRMDTFIKANCPLIVVDYAHTPDALEKALTTLAEIPHSGKLYCVFGCGGNRDVNKRPLMGSIATKYADYVIITSDNPRDEDPLAIIDQICSGVNKENFMIIENREQAIQYAKTLASANDIILIAGKGHETYQEVKGIKHHFSDHEIVNATWSNS